MNFRQLMVIGAAVLSACFKNTTESSAASQSPETAQRQAIVATDGPLTVNGTQQLNEYSALASNVSAGATSVTVSDIAQLDSATFGPIAAGDLVMIIQMQGASIDTTDTFSATDAGSSGYGTITSLNGAGLYETIEVASVNRTANSLTFTSGCGLKNGYSVSGRTQVIRVPQLESLTVSITGTVIPLPWDGTRGGVVALHVRGTLSLAGSVDVSGRGFRGGAVDGQASPESTDVSGYRSASGAQGAEKGEGIAGSASTYDGLGGRYGRGAPANAGGGGNGVFAGGGGGANGNGGGVWAGQGVMAIGTGVVGPVAWALDPGRALGSSIGTGSLTANNPGGGRGGYSYSSQNRNGVSEGPGASGWQGNLRRERGGLGGRPLDGDATSRVFLGGGGGAGDGEAGQAGAGGTGGGLIYVLADTITGTGGFAANGANGGSTVTPHRAGGGGGGAGGTVVLRANSLSNFNVAANGGNGGNHSLLNEQNDTAAGPGAGGSGGYVAVTNGTPTRSAVGGAAGVSISNGVNEFPLNGATNGANGIANATITLISPTDLADVPLCLAPANLGITVTNNRATSIPGDTVTYVITVTNQGPGTATRARVFDTLPASLSAITWNCNSGSSTGCANGTAATASGTGSINQLTTLGPNQSVTYSVTATISTTVTGSLVNQAAIIPPPITSDPVLTNNVAVDTDTLTPQSDLALSVVANPTPANEDGTLTYVVSVENRGLSQATGVSLVFNLPLLADAGSGQFAFTSVTGTGWTCNRSGMVVTCNRSTPNSLAAGATATVTIVGRVVAESGALATSATVTTSGSQDLVPGNNSVMLSTPVNSSNDAPVNVVPAQTLTTTEDTSVSIAPLSVQDVDVGSGQLLIRLTATSGFLTLGVTTGLSFAEGDGTDDAVITIQGTLTDLVRALGSLTFSPAANFAGSASVTITTNDLGNSGDDMTPRQDVDTITILVTGVNDTPQVADDAAVVDEDDVVAVMVLLNDTDPDGEPLTVVGNTPATHGVVSLANNVLTYQPAPNYFGPDSFTYQVLDASGGRATASVTVTVNPVNDPPDAVDDVFGVIAGSSTAAPLPVLANDTSAPDMVEALTITAVTTATQGTVVLDASGIIYTPTASASGTDTFTYTITDPGGLTDTATVTIRIGEQNDPPVNTVPGAQTTPEDTVLAFATASSNAISVADPDVGDGGVQITLTASVGTVSVRADAGVSFGLNDGTDDPTVQFTGSLSEVNVALSGLSYLPPRDFSGRATLTVLTNDLGNTGVDGAKSDTDTVTITVTAVNDPPSALNDFYSVGEDAVNFQLYVLSNDGAGDVGDSLRVSAVTPPTHGTATISSDGQSIEYTPAPDYYGADTLTYTTSDMNGGTATATVTLDVVNINDPPSARDDIAVVAQDAIDHRIDVLANDSTAPDPAGETLQIVSVRQPSNGAVRFSTARDAVLYTPRRGFYGRDSFLYTVQDSSGSSSSAQVEITVGADQDADGLSDGEEAALGTDPADPDSDDDGLDDGIEAKLARTNPLDDDTDDDGLLDGTEDASGDGDVDPEETNPRLFDTDSDGLSDGLELSLTRPQGRNTNTSVFRADLDPTTNTSPLISDTDRGGVHDGDEDTDGNGRIDPGETNPRDAADDRVDTDRDGLTDATELSAGLDPRDADSDNDGVLDGADGLANSDDDALIDARDPDSDNDGILDGTEAGIAFDQKPNDTDLAANAFVGDADPSTTTNPRTSDSDGDGLADGAEDKNKNGQDDQGETDATKADTDADGLPDGIELTGTTKTDPELPDTDGDGLLDGEEDLNADGTLDAGETNPLLVDTDRGGRTDKEERVSNTNPRDAKDDFVVSGGAGCSTAPGPTLLVLAVGLFLTRRRLRRLGVASALTLSSLVMAQTAGAGLDVLRYRPGMGARDFLDFESAQVPKHLQLSARLSVGHADDPLVLRVPNERTVAARLVDGLTFFDLSGGIGISNRFEVTVGLPLSLIQSGQGGTIDPSLAPAANFAPGDLRVGFKYSVFAPESPFQLGFSLPVWFPTGNGQSWLGGGPVVFGPKVIAELNIPAFRVGASVGVNLRTASVQFLNLQVGQELTWNVGALVPLFGKDYRLSVMATVAGAAGLNTPSIETTPITALGGFRFGVFDRLYVDLAAGGGLTRGEGAPTWQLVAAVGYVAAPIKLPEQVITPVADGTTPQTVVAATSNGPTAPPVEAPPEPVPAETEKFEFDSDQDGVADASDKCPASKETINGQGDDDGCPDTGEGAFRQSEKGKLAPIKPITFMKGTAQLTGQGESVLRQLALHLKANRNLKARIEVFVTERATREENNTLSSDRARAIRSLLVESNLGRGRVQVKGLGVQRPLDPSVVTISFGE